AYTASIAAVCSDLFVMPEDPAGRIILSVHAYTPYDFALADGGRRNFDPNNVSNSTEIGSFMNTLYDRFVKNGIPVVIGEYGARDKKGNTQDRVNFAVYYTASAHVRGIACCWWDNNAHKGSGELFGILDRSRCVWSCPEIKDAIIAGSVYGD
ncbi:MAG: endoglucanase, partial [Clostridiales bacterium]|nr:endoglucanase [Clostridiales bacterium]